MRQSSVLSQATLGVTLVAVTIVVAGCSQNNSSDGDHGITGHYAHNVAHLRCGPHHTAENYSIYVAANQQVLVKPDDTIVFLCEGDTVSWSTQDSNTLIKINFTDNYAEGLLGAGHSKFEKKHETDKQTVQDQTGHQGRVYKYSITVDDGTSSFSLDPHVIPMGK
jgi:hypothetical protein